MQIIQLILHLDKYLSEVVSLYHNYFYLILFVVIFAETGLVVTPFLPGDSLLFVAGSLCAGAGSTSASGGLDFVVLVITIFIAAFCGDNSNFFIGKFIGERLFKNTRSKIFRRDILNKTHDFYERHGRKTVVIARFIPLIRTFVPFVAGVGEMQYARFISFSILGSALWVLVFVGGGFMFGNLPLVKNHLSVVILVVMLVSVIPIVKMVVDEFRICPKNK